MREVVIQIPTFESEQNIEIDVKINGKKRTMKYRVEIIDWKDDDKPTEAKIGILQEIISEHDKDWELIQIGAPTRGNIPVMFRKRPDRIVAAD
ncbi:MAG: hypothetical protein ACOYVF_09145 [Candidatus Zixiibacteriota bacterium]